MKKLPLSFFLRDDVIRIAKDLLGKVLVTNWQGDYTSGRIVETEAYKGETDRASHASKGRTPRTEVMFGEGGRAYVYLCYGIHQMFNIVTNRNGIPDAVLIRSVEPMEGIDIMLRRTGRKEMTSDLTAGPGRVGKAFGFHTSQCGQLVNNPELFIADDGFKTEESMIATSPRIGVDYAGEHAELHYRFFLKNSKYISGKKQIDRKG